MIKPGYLKAQLAKSRAHGQTSPFLRRLICSTVDAIARDHYADAYATKCVQAGEAVSVLLRRVGIRSRLWLGAFCAAEVFEDPSFGGWGGFWGDEHHAWVITEFKELVDLSVAEMTRHPRCSRRDGIPVPPIWWNDIGVWPPVLRYLPDIAVRARFPDGSDIADLAFFLGKVEQRFDETLANGSVEDVSFAPMLESTAGMNVQQANGDPWLQRVTVFQERSIPFPPWIVARHDELIKAHQTGRRAPTRLEHVTENGTGR